MDARCICLNSRTLGAIRGSVRESVPLHRASRHAWIDTMILKWFPDNRVYARLYVRLHVPVTRLPSSDTKSSLSMNPIAQTGSRM